ncbi:MAG: hypothetical protein DIU68_007830 [Chloroflexota bacterium]|nr:MAG: hypothetical protein DIU68_11345 [Chloroflexota bacterium]
MSERSIFADEWRDCLRAQYMSVVRNNDQVTLKTLVGVMYEVGFGEEELRELYVRATMRAEHVADDFVPDMNVLERPKPEPEPQAVETSVAEPEPEEEEAGDEPPDTPGGEAPFGLQQLSLF